jgi:DNA-binding NarL/FixJ family response regulator
MKFIDGVVYLEMNDAESCGIGDPAYLWKEKSKAAKWGVFVEDPDNNKKLLLEYNSLSKKHKLKVLNFFGDPTSHLIKQSIRSMVIEDPAAKKFYYEFLYDNNNHLPADTADLLALAAGWLNMLIHFEADKRQVKKLLNISLTEFYVQVTELIEQENIALPSNIIELRQTIDSYKSNGFKSLIPKSNGYIKPNEVPQSRPTERKETKKDPIKIALIDDHILVRDALTAVIGGFDECVVVNQSCNGKEMINAFLAGTIPDIVILDLSMPVMDGFETADWLCKNFPRVHILMLTMYDPELSLVRLLQKGIRGFLKKNTPTSELKFAILSIMQTGFYYSSHITGKLVNLFYNKEDGRHLQRTCLSDQEIEFLKLACSDLTYKDIAKNMSVNIRSVDSLRNHLFQKLDVKSRVGLAMVAIKNGMVTF